MSGQNKTFQSLASDEGCLQCFVQTVVLIWMMMKTDEVLGEQCCFELSVICF